MAGSSTRFRRAFLVAASTAVALVVAALPAIGLPTLANLGGDPYTNASSQHATQVEPDSFAFGTTIVAAAQTGRFTNGGSSNICWSTSKDSGSTWTSGCLPGVTVFSTPAGSYDRVSDPAVAYDPKHDVWLISSLGLSGGSSVKGAAILTSRSTDGGTTWGNPVVTAAATGTNDFDKNWIVCDTWAASPYFGNCYTQWDNYGSGNRLLMSTSTDGGASWGTPKQTANAASGLGGQPVVQPSGTVVVPSANANETAIIAFRSTDGGATWSSTVSIATVKSHGVAGGLRTGPLPSAEVDASGKVYVVWQDCRFRKRCASNDIVMSTSTNGTTWTTPVRIPIDAVTSTVDHFIPGIAVDRASSGSSARLALGYYFYPATNCSSSTCQLSVGFISSQDGGATWSASQTLAGPMTIGWIASTTQGRMVGDYISTSFVGSVAFPIFVVATANSGTTFAERMTTVATGLSVTVAAAAASGLDVAVTRTSDHPAPGSAVSRQ
ncbi:MAG: sialidase family protein [Actinomycetota bacterium]